MKPFRLYLDNCCFNRPYDDQSSLPVYLETQAKETSCDFLITTDKKLIRKTGLIGKMRVINPLNFVTDYAEYIDG